MFFNSIEFAVFLPVVFAVYWLCWSKDLRLQNAFIVVSSYGLVGLAFFKPDIHQHPAGLPCGAENLAGG